MAGVGNTKGRKKQKEAVTSNFQSKHGSAALVASSVNTCMWSQRMVLGKGTKSQQGGGASEEAPGNLGRGLELLL